MVSSLNMIDELIDKVDGFLFGIKGLSVNFPLYITLEELEKVVTHIKKSDKKIMVSLNKNMHNNDLDKLKEALDVINRLDIDGIFYYDISLINFKEDGLIKHPLIWHQEHLTTNYATCNFYKEYGVSGACLSSEITLDEIKKIRSNTNMELFVPIFGYLPMFTSKRTLVNNYLDTFNLTSNSYMHYIEKEGYRYPIIDDKTKTEVYSANILNGIGEKFLLENMKIDYVLMNSFNISDSDFIKTIDLYNELTIDNIKNTDEEITKLFPNNDKGFFYKETIFRVKKNEK